MKAAGAHIKKSVYPPRFGLALLWLGLALCFTFGCQPYFEAHDDHVGNLVLDSAREAGFPVRLIAVPESAKLAATAARERERDTWSTLLLFSKDDFSIEPGAKLDRSWARDFEAGVRNRRLSESTMPLELLLAHAFVEELGKARGVQQLGSRPLPFQAVADPANDYLLALVLSFSFLVVVALGVLSKRARASFNRARARVATWLFRAPSIERLRDPESLPRPGLLLGLGLLLIGGVYASTLGTPFIWDDRKLILEEVIEAKGAPLDYLFHPFWRSLESGIGYRGFFRPLTTWSFALDAFTGSGNSTVFHLTNIALHLGVVLLLFLVARKWGARPIAAILVAFCFGVAPRLTENVAWVSGRTDVLATLFGLGALYCYPLRALPDERHPIAKAWLAALWLGLGLLSKEVALAFLVVIAIDELAHQRRAATHFRGLAARALPFLATLALYGGLRFHALGNVLTTDAEYVYGDSRLFAGLEAAGRYAVLLVDFMRPRTQIGFLPMRVWSFVALGAGVGAGVLLLAYRGVKRILSRTAPLPHRAELGLWLAFAAILPVLHIVPLPANVIAADRFLYVPLLGLALAAALWGSSYESARLWRSAIALLLLGSASIAGVLIRNQDYASELAFWVSAVRSTRPEDTLPERELANVYFRAQEHELATALYMRVVREERQRFVLDAEWRNGPLGQLSNAQAALGNYGEALRLGQLLIASGSATPREFHNLALIYLHLEDFANARRLSQMALDQSSEYVAARQTLDQLPELEVERAAIERLSPAEQLPARARYLVRIGARAEAQRACTDALASHADDPKISDPLWDYLILFGDTPLLHTAADHIPLNDPLLRVSLEARLSLAGEIAASVPLVRPYFARYDGAELGL